MPWTRDGKWSQVCPFTGKVVLQRHVLALELLHISYIITTVILSFDWQWNFWRASMWYRCRPMVQVSFFVGISSIYRWMAGGDTTRLMSIMAMGSNGHQVFSLPPLCCLRREGIWRWILRQFWSFVFGQESVLARDNPTYKNLLEWSVQLPFVKDVLPSQSMSNFLSVKSGQNCGDQIGSRTRTPAYAVKLFGQVRTERTNSQ
jgi:hypothetical protein